VLVGPGQQVLGAGEVPVATRAAGDAVEADPEELLASVLAAGHQALAAARAPADAVAAGQPGRDRAGLGPGGPAAADSGHRSGRTAGQPGVCARLAGEAGWLAQATGLPLDPYFAAPKMTWLRENLTGRTAWSSPRPTAGCWPGSGPAT